MTTAYNQVVKELRTAYDGKVAERAEKRAASWKLAERARFLALVQAEGKERLLEIGMGTGRDSRFFRDQGLTVVGTDLSPAMVAHSRDQGLDARVVDFASLDQEFPAESFDAVYAINCLLHVPKPDLPAILTRIRTILRPDGLFYWGQYGGVDEEGIWDSDHYVPKRFFARYTDEQFLQLARAHFHVDTFTVITVTMENDYFHAATLRKV